MKNYNYPKELCSKEHFLDCVKNHKMEILKDEFPYRHIRFQNPATSNQWFEVVTYPHNLVFSGDMGTYVFSRVYDMFAFFRRKDLQIDPQYFAQKCTSYGKHEKIEEFSLDYFRARVQEWMDDAEFSTAAREEAEVSIEYNGDGDGWKAMRSVIEFEASDGTRFRDFWEIDCKVYTFHFLWCCYAVVWAVQQYDKHKHAV